MANFNQAIQWLKEGKKVRRKDWGNKTLYGYSSNESNFISFYDKSGYLTSSFLHDIQSLEATDWEIYCEEFSLTTIQEGTYAFREKNTAVPNRVRLHSNAIKKLHIEGSVVEILGLMIEIDDSLAENEALVYYKEKESLSDKKLKAFVMIGTYNHEVNYKEKDVKEKIQNVQRRYKKYLKWLTNQFQCASHTHEPILKSLDKIFKEEFGDKLIQGGKNGI